jgi:outer membrane protein assembly factor BamE (lipoprotein component of BamABCDE complex)
MRLRPTRNLARQSGMLAVAACLAASLGGCVGYEGEFDRGYIVDQHTLEQVKIGATTKPETLAAMGTPSTTSTVGGDAWYYIGQKMSRPIGFLTPRVRDQNVLAIYFDKNGKVERIANYGLQDGKVFDYVSRTTPTGGMEPDFLRNMLHSFLVFS